MTPRQPTSPKWSDEAILSSIKSHHEEFSESPRRIDWKRSTPTHPSASTVELRFGSWSRAIAAAGLVAPGRGPRGPRWLEPRILQAIHRHNEAYGQPPTHRDWVSSNDEHPSSATVINRFGTFANAVRSAGLQPLARLA